MLKPLKVTSPIAKDASQNTTSTVDTARPAPVIRWKIDNTDVIWGLYTVKWGDRGLLSNFFKSLLSVDFNIYLKIFCASELPSYSSLGTNTQ